MNKASVYIVDDDPAVRDSLTLLFEEDGIPVQAFENGEAFLAACNGASRGCVIIDVRMPGMDGLQLQAELARRGIPLAIVFLTGHGDIPMSVRAIKAGAVDFLTKPVTATDLLHSVEAALQDSIRLRVRAESNLSASTRLAHLTDREREVMQLAITGHQNKDIARQLGISHRTVEVHRARIMHKTGATSLLELARMAEAVGIRP